MKKKQYTTNVTKILNKEAKELPQLMWFYMIDNLSHKIIHISLAQYKKTLPEHYYIDIFNSKIYFHIHKFEPISMMCDNDDLNHFILSHKDRSLYSSYFNDNVCSTDVYTKDDFLNIYQEVLDVLFNNNDGLDCKFDFDRDNIRETINMIHRQYMFKKTHTLLEIERYTALKHLQTHKFSLDSSQVLKGNVQMLPAMKWIFMESNDHPHVFKIDLAVNFNGQDYIGVVDQKVYTLNDNVTLVDKCNIPTDKVLGPNPVLYTYDFQENVLYNDVYNYNDIKNIIREISFEIGELFGNEQSTDTVNFVPNKMRDYVMNEGEVKKLIKEAHRSCMNIKK